MKSTIEPTTIPYPRVELSAASNPIAAIMSDREFKDCIQALSAAPRSENSLVSSASRALLFALTRNRKPDHVVEIGTFRGGTSEIICMALAGNGRGTLDTVGPFDSDYFLPNFQEWPENLRSRLRFFPMNSMDYYMKMVSQRIRPDIVFVDGHHDYEFALYDIQLAARWLTPSGFIVIDNVSQVGPYYAGIDFLKANPLWTNCSVGPLPQSGYRAFDPSRVFIPDTDFLILRSPQDYLVTHRPRTFGEFHLTAPRVAGVTVNISEPDSETLYVECVLRGFGPLAEVSANTSQAIKGDSGEVSVHLKEPLTIDMECETYRVEPWLVWQGDRPLKLAALPRVF